MNNRKSFYMVKRLYMWEALQVENLDAKISVDESFGIGHCRVYATYEEAEKAANGAEILTLLECDPREESHE